MRATFVLSVGCTLVLAACSGSSGSVNDPGGSGNPPGANPPPGQTPPPGETPPSAPPLGKANGSLSDWQTLGAMPLPRANHCATFTNGYLVVIGGNYKPKGATDFKNIGEVDVAKVNPVDGT